MEVRYGEVARTGSGRPFFTYPKRSGAARRGFFHSGRVPPPKTVLQMSSSSSAEPSVRTRPGLLLINFGCGITDQTASVLCECVLFPIIQARGGHPLPSPPPSKINLSLKLSPPAVPRCRSPRDVPKKETIPGNTVNNTQKSIWNFDENVLCCTGWCKTI